MLVRKKKINKFLKLNLKLPKKNLTKAESLEFLNNNYKGNFLVPKFIYFTLDYFKKNKDKALSKVHNIFKNKKIIVRSSSKDEDNFNKSNAGKYLSVVTTTKKKDLINSIDYVIKKFRNNKKTN